MIAQLDSRYVRTRPARALSRLVSYAFFEGRPLTTRGRWINPLLMPFARAIANRSKEGFVDRPVFILGSGRTGTTVLGKILSLHRSVGFLNEPKLMWHAAYPGEDLNGNYGEEPAQYRLDGADADEHVAACIKNLYSTYLSVTRNTRIVDKYPELIFRAAFVKQIFPDSRFIVLTRNGYDTCRSVSAWSEAHKESHDDSNIDWWGRNNRKWIYLVDQLVRSNETLRSSAGEIAHFTDPDNMAAVEWMLSTKEGLTLVQDYQDSTIRLRYEKLVSSPERVIPELLDFCGLSHDPVVVNYATASLKEKPTGRPIQLHPLIDNYFHQVMSESGYTSD